MCIEKIPSNAGNLSSNSSFNGDILEFEAPDYIDEIQELYYNTEPEDESFNEFNEFNEYLWMENEEEFEEEEMQRLEEQELILQCNSAMDELALLDDLRQLECEHHKDCYYLSEIAEESNLNPFAEEFVPRIASLT